MKNRQNQRCRITAPLKIRDSASEVVHGHDLMKQKKLKQVFAVETVAGLDRGSRRLSFVVVGLKLSQRISGTLPDALPPRRYQDVAETFLARRQ